MSKRFSLDEQGLRWRCVKCGDVGRAANARQAVAAGCGCDASTISPQPPADLDCRFRGADVGEAGCCGSAVALYECSIFERCTVDKPKSKYESGASIEIACCASCERREPRSSDESKASE